MKVGHICIPIDVCIEKLRQGVNLFEDQMGEEEAWNQLDQMKREGKKYVSGCSNTDTEGKCKCDEEE